MLTFTKYLLVIYLSLVSMSAFSNYGDQLSGKQRRLYNQTLELCRSKSLMDIIKKRVKYFNSSAVGTLFGETYKQSYQNFKKGNVKIPFGNKLEELVSSDGFYEGMNSCFGQNESDKVLFLTSLFALDVAGKSVGSLPSLAVTGLLKIGFGRIFTGVKLLSPTSFVSLISLGVIPPMAYYSYIEYKLRADSTVFSRGLKSETEKVNSLRAKIPVAAIKAIIKEFQQGLIAEEKKQSRTKNLINLLSVYSSNEDLNDEELLFINNYIEVFLGLYDDGIIPFPENDGVKDLLTRLIEQHQ